MVTAAASSIVLRRLYALPFCYVAEISRLGNKPKNDMFYCVEVTLKIKQNEICLCYMFQAFVV